MVVGIDALFWRGRTGRHPGVRLEPAAQPWPRPGPRRHGLLLGLSPWLGLGLVLLVWEILGLDTGSHQPHLTISALAEAFRALNAATLLVWILVGVGYGAARARAPLLTSHGASGGTGERPFLGAAMAARVPAKAPALLLPASRVLGVGFWVGLVAAGVLADLIARRSGGRLATAEELVRLLTAPVVINVVLIVAWTYAGYHLFAH